MCHSNCSSGPTQRARSAARRTSRVARPSLQRPRAILDDRLRPRNSKSIVRRPRVPRLEVSHARSCRRRRARRQPRARPGAPNEPRAGRSDGATRSWRSSPGSSSWAWGPSPPPWDVRHRLVRRLAGCAARAGRRRPGRRDPASFRLTHATGFLVASAVAGVAIGLFLLVRGLRAYRAGEPVRGTGTSRIESLAAGRGPPGRDDRGRPGGPRLASPERALACTTAPGSWRTGGQDRATILDEERAVGFRLRDATGSLRVFPRGAHWDAPMRFRDQSDWSGENPPGLSLNDGPAVAPATLDRDAAVTALLTVHAAGDGSADGPGGLLDGGALAALAASGGERNVNAGIGGGPFGVAKGRRHYEEPRLEPGDIVTIVGTRAAVRRPRRPGADRMTATSPIVGLDDPEVAAEVAEARAAGTLLTPRTRPGATRRSPGSGSAGPCASRSWIPGRIGRAARPGRGGDRGGGPLRHRARRPRHRRGRGLAAADRRGRTRGRRRPRAGPVPARAPRRLLAIVVRYRRRAIVLGGLPA